jgi:hypothetical protein
VEIRAGRFVAKSGMLSYDVVLTRDAAAKPLAAAVQFVVTGDAKPGSVASDNGHANTVAPDPVPVSIDSQRVLRGSLALPEGFKPRQARVQVLDRNGAALGMRVLLVK